MNILVLGAGLQGSSCAYDLLRQNDVETVTVADLEPDGLAGFVPDHEKLKKVQADFSDAAGIREIMGSHDIVLSAAPYYFNLDMAKAAIGAGCHFSDLGGNTQIVRDQLAMTDEAKAAGVTLVPDVGLAPGMINVIASEGVRRFERPRSIRMYVGGLPQNPRPPLNYQVAYSLEGMLDYYDTMSWMLRDGTPQEVEALTELEMLDFGELGELEAFHTAGGASLQPWDYADRLDELFYKTLRYPGHAKFMHAFKALGLIDLDPVDVKGTAVVPRDAFLACIEPHLNLSEPDLVALRVIAEGENAGVPSKVTFDVLDTGDEETGITAMERTTGFTLAIVGLFLGRGVIAERGAAPSYRLIPYDPYVQELAKRGIEVRVS
ncbi:MAG: saccharopine dehydrogenase family protein [Gemmatimonadota bacterium]